MQVRAQPKETAVKNPPCKSAQPSACPLPASDVSARPRRPAALSVAARAALIVGAAVTLAACEPRVPKVAVPAGVPDQVVVVPAAAPMPASPASDASLPTTAEVLAPGVAGKADHAAGRSNSSLSATQEKSQMPMPGQNNDHSAPLTPAQRASSP
jgi:hypothetical protein